MAGQRLAAVVGDHVAEGAGKVPVKLMMPLILLIVPAAFIVLLFGPVYMYMTGQQLAGQ